MLGRLGMETDIGRSAANGGFAPRSGRLRKRHRFPEAAVQGSVTNAGCVDSGQTGFGNAWLFNGPSGPAAPADFSRPQFAILNRRFISAKRS